MPRLPLILEVVEGSSRIIAIPFDELLFLYDFNLKLEEFLDSLDG